VSFSYHFLQACLRPYTDFTSLQTWFGLVEVMPGGKNKSNCGLVDFMYTSCNFPSRNALFTSSSCKFQ